MENLNSSLQDVLGSLTTKSSHFESPITDGCRIQTLVSAAQIPERHADHQLIKRLINNPEGAWGAEFIKLRDLIPFGFLYAMLGKRGTGKTQMAACLIVEACRRDYTARYVKAMDLFRDIKACYGVGARDERDVVREYSRVHMLVIDEAHERGSSDWENRTLTNIIDHRYDGRKCTLLLSNQDKKQFAESIGPSVVSRIHETGDAITCDWESFR